MLREKNNLVPVLMVKNLLCLWFPIVISSFDKCPFSKWRPTKQPLDSLLGKQFYHILYFWMKFQSKCMATVATNWYLVLKAYIFKVSLSKKRWGGGTRKFFRSSRYFNFLLSLTTSLNIHVCALCGRIRYD